MHVYTHSILILLALDVIKQIEDIVLTVLKLVVHWAF
jgi:hypothetical protein